MQYVGRYPILNNFTPNLFWNYSYSPLTVQQSFFESRKYDDEHFLRCVDEGSYFSRDMGQLRCPGAFAGLQLACAASAHLLQRCARVRARICNRQTRADQLRSFDARARSQRCHNTRNSVVAKTLRETDVLFKNLAVLLYAIF